MHKLDKSANLIVELQSYLETLVEEPNCRYDGCSTKQVNVFIGDCDGVSP